MTLVLIADDHYLFRRGVRDVLEGIGKYECIEASNGDVALKIIENNHPKVAILDLSMPKVDGLEVLSQAKKIGNPPYFIILTLYNDNHLVERALDLGASAYLLKENAEDELERCLTVVLAGRRYISQAISLDSASHPKTQNANLLLSLLTPAEQQILAYVGEYKTSRDIAIKLSISIRTVQNHRSHITKKLNLSGQNALLQYAIDLNKPT